MLDIGFPELAIVAVVVLIVIGPKELPTVLRGLGRWAGKARAMVREFQGSIDDMIRETELDEVKKKVESVASHDVGKEIENTIDPSGEMARELSMPPPESEAGPEPVDEPALSDTSETDSSPATPGAESAPSAEPEPDASPTVAAEETASGAAEKEPASGPRRAARS